MMADGRRQVLQGDLYMQIDRSIVLEKYIGNSLRIQPVVRFKKVAKAF